MFWFVWGALNIFFFWKSAVKPQVCNSVLVVSSMALEKLIKVGDLT